MATKYLGAQFDIHGGGIDLVFPHHENEMAQSRAAGDGFANYWLHNAWVTTSGEKMSKSLGNSLLVREVVKRVRPVELRYYLLSAHYRSHQEYSEDALTEIAASYRRLERFVQRAAELVGTALSPKPNIPDAFADAMDDDLGVPAGLAVLHETVTEGNRLLDAAEVDKERLLDLLSSVRRMLDVLGVDPLAAPWRDQPGSDSGSREVIDALVGVALGERAEARDRKDFAAADRIRDQLSEAGVVIEDTPAGPRWTLRDAT
jgi:cysteinyl-tRNA synthetase